MKFRHVLPIIFGIVLLSFMSSYFRGEKPTPRSPKIISVHTLGNGMPGSGHAFGYGVVYKIVGHEPYNNETHAVVKSDEPDVEIWTPIPQVVAMMDGIKFHVIKDATTIDERFQTISARNR